MRTPFLRALFLLAALAAATQALAHAHLERASPPANGSLRNAPREVSISFSENLEGSFSSITVVGAGGAPRDPRRRGQRAGGQPQPENPAGLAQTIAAGALSRELARAVGRYAQNRREL
jgi:methionine-rich copper-binding protein CopC